MRVYKVVNLTGESPLVVLAPWRRKYEIGRTTRGPRGSLVFAFRTRAQANALVDQLALGIEIARDLFKVLRCEAKVPRRQPRLVASVADAGAIAAFWKGRRPAGLFPLMPGTVACEWVRPVAS